MRVFEPDKSADAGQRELDAQRGVYTVRDQQTYYVRGDDVTPHALLKRVPGSTTPHYQLRFDNFVGLADVGGARFDVRQSKLTTRAFNSMLDGVVEDAAALAFDFEAPTALSVERSGLARDVAYHAVAYLRHVMGKGRGGEAMLGQFLQVARHPHRRREHESAWLAPERVTHLTPGSLRAIASRPDRLARIGSSSSLARTGLGLQLRQASGAALFPNAVLTTRHTETLDTHENRLVKHVLCLAADLVASFAEQRITSVDLKMNLSAMRDELSFMRSHDFLSDVGPLTQVPLTSTVLQRRDGYREFLQHYLALGASSELAGESRWERLLDLKDSALLYEMWCFFETKRCLDQLLGFPIQAYTLKRTTTKVALEQGGTVVRYRDGIELVYNATYRRPNGSYSVPLRPDIVVRVPQANRWRSLILDAKLKFDGERLQPGPTGTEETAEPSEDREAWKRDPTRADLYKMHTYRDAIREAVGAFVLYPGSATRRYCVQGGALTHEGVGAVALVPGSAPQALAGLLQEFLAGAK